jgi:DNA repair protein SbcD/Mre11
MEPIIGVITDTHLSLKNEDQIKDIFKQAIAKVKSKGFKELYHSGDHFDNRKYQTQSTLKTSKEIFRMFEEEGVELRIIPGNHDKANYESEDSYLDVFDRYPSIKVIKTQGYFDHGNIRVHMIPFFKESTMYSSYLSESIKNIDKSKKNVLITHVAIDGVKNNDGSVMENVVGVSSVIDNYDLTLIGHYHDYSELANGKIVYIGSTHQHNFGENKRKGITFLYDDLSMTQEAFVTKQFNTVNIDLNTIPAKELNVLMEEYGNNEDMVRFKFNGPKEKLKGIDKSKFDKLGIDIKVSVDEVDVDVSYADVVDFKGFDDTSIIIEWSDFAKKKELSEDIVNNGKERLVRVLNNK